MIRRRFDELRRELLAIFGRVRVYQRNDADTEPTLYGVTEAELELMAGEIGDSVDRWIDTEDDEQLVSWWSRFEDEAALLGIALALANLARLSPAYAATRTAAQVIMSDAYRAHLAAAQFASREFWAGLAAALRADIAQIIGRGIAAGTSAAQVRAQIAARIEVMKARALQFARTAITNMVREIRLAEADFANAYLGMRLGLLWSSAFLPTTRSWHASRHGGVFTPAEVRDFYSRGANRINCYCGTSEVMLDENGKPLITGKLKAAMKKEKRAWQETQPG